MKWESSFNGKFWKEEKVQTFDSKACKTKRGILACLLFVLFMWKGLPPYWILHD